MTLLFLYVSSTAQIPSLNTSLVIVRPTTLPRKQQVSDSPNMRSACALQSENVVLALGLHSYQCGNPTHPRDFCHEYMYNKLPHSHAKVAF